LLVRFLADDDKVQADLAEAERMTGLINNINNFYSLVQKWFYEYKMQKQVTLASVGG